jgi:hypothetical protein
MKPSSCKNKGRRLQLQIRNDILERFPQLKEDDIVNTSMGCGGEDLKLSPAARSLLPISIECKNQERLDIWGALSQCKTNAPAHTTPCVIFKRNHTDTFAVIPWKALLTLFTTQRTTTNITNTDTVPPENLEQIKALVTELYSLL